MLFTGHPMQLACELNCFACIPKICKKGTRSGRSQSPSFIHLSNDRKMNKRRMELNKSSEKVVDSNAQKDWFSSLKGMLRDIFRRSLVGTGESSKPMVDVRYSKKIKKADGTKVKYKFRLQI
jgi:hypothetical protein